MLNVSNILIYGKDVTLLETRGWILAKAGFEVTCCTTADEVERTIREHRPDVLVLCHTLPFEECTHMKQIAQQSQPSIRALVLSTHFSGFAMETENTTLTIYPEPLQLITAVQQLAQRNGHRAEAVATV